MHLFILSGENITRYAKDISIFMVEFSLFYSGKVHFWLYLCHLGLYISRSGIPYAVDFTLSFDTSFVPIEAFLDVRTLTFTAENNTFLNSYLLIFAYNMSLFFWFNVLTISIKMCRRFKMSQKLFLQVKIVMYLSPRFGGSHFLVF